jgi:hypothetical protein
VPAAAAPVVAPEPAAVPAQWAAALAPGKGLEISFTITAIHVTQM